MYLYQLHQYEPINIQTYSLDTPILVIDLYSKLDDQLKIKIGLVNPISNTSYMTIGNHKTIFQTEIIKNHIELMDLSDFFESHIFSMPLNEITSFELYRRGSKVSVNKLTKKGQNWKSKMYRSITNKNVDAKLNSILNIKTHTIIDEQDEKLKTFLKNYMDNPLYTIKIKSGKKEVTYKISSLINALPKLKLEKRQYFIMLASDRQFPYIIKKESLDKFYMRYSQIR